MRIWRGNEAILSFMPKGGEYTYGEVQLAHIPFQILILGDREVIVTAPFIRHSRLLYLIVFRRFEGTG